MKKKCYMLILCSLTVLTLSACNKNKDVHDGGSNTNDTSSNDSFVAIESTKEEEVTNTQTVGGNQLVYEFAGEVKEEDKAIVEEAYEAIEGEEVEPSYLSGQTLDEQFMNSEMIANFNDSLTDLGIKVANCYIKDYGDNDYGISIDFDNSDYYADGYTNKNDDGSISCYIMVYGMDGEMVTDYTGELNIQ